MSLLSFGLPLVARWRAQLFTAAFALACAMAVMFTAAAPAQAQAYHDPMHYGVRCQDDFENAWNPTIDTYSMCDNFITRMSGTDYIDFYFNLHGAAPTFNNGDPTETCDACGGVDSVDFYFMSTHGGTDSTDAFYTMWDQDSSAFSSLMRFGEAGEQVKVFATYACDTLFTADGGFVNRWWSALAGGVKVLLGAHDLVYDGNDQKGTEFTSRMQDGEPIGNAWLEAVWYADNDNHPSFANTGADPNDCWNRAGLNLPGLPYEPTLRDGQIGWVCWAGWNGS
jgi:hypothetical protein